MTNYWLVKSEPETYSIDDLKQDKTTFWDGVRNHVAKNNMMKMKKGELVLFYHSNAKPSGVAGVGKVLEEAYADTSALNKKSKYFDPKSTLENPRWFMVDICFVKKFPRILPLSEIKGMPSLKNMTLVKNSRLSVQNVTKKEFEKIIDLINRWEKT